MSEASNPVRVSIVSARFNGLITSRLLVGARRGLDHAGARVGDVRYCAGAWELPVLAHTLAERRDTDAVIALGCVVRGQTPHFDYVAGEAARGLADVALTTRVPVVFGVLTTDTIEQAMERAAGTATNKGWEAAITAVETVIALRSARES